MNLFSSGDVDNPSVIDKVAEVANLPTGKVGRAIALYHLSTTAYTAARNVYKQLENKRMYHVYVASNDGVYETVLEWLSTFGLKDNSKEVNISTSRTWDGDNLVNSSLKTKYTTSRRRKIDFDGHKVYVMIEEHTIENRYGAGAVKGQRIIFMATKREAYYAVLDKLSDIHEAHEKDIRPPRMYTPMNGFFESTDSIPLRSLDSVILKPGELDNIVNDLQNFLDSEERYLKLGLPWHRGYLFHGTVGTGKTSIAKAIASHFGLDVHYLPLGDLGKDGELTQLLTNVRPRSMLLLEDVDVFSAATSRDAEQDELSLSGLLNALDGLMTPHGMITVMTTNHIEKLDEALIRPGRVDVQHEFTLLNQQQGEDLFRHFYGFDAENVNFEGKSPSNVVGIFKQHLDDPIAAQEVLQA